MVAVCMVRVLNMSVEETAESRYGAPRGSATGCAVTTKVSKATKSPQHRSILVREFLHKNKNIRIMHSPKGSPCLNAVEECWRQALLASEYRQTFSDMCQTILTYYRTARFNLELLKYANKKTELNVINL